MAEANQQLRQLIGARLSEIRGKKEKKYFWPEHGLDPAQMGRYENAKEIPSLEKLYDICAKCDISPTWLIFGRGYRRLRDVVERSFSIEMMEIFDRIEKMLPDFQRAQFRTQFETNLRRISDGLPPQHKGIVEKARPRTTGRGKKNG